MTDAQRAFESLTLSEIEEVSGELHRRIAVSLRRLGEARADLVDDRGIQPRRRAVEVAAGIEHAAWTLVARRAGLDPPPAGLPRQPSITAALTYAAPTLPALLQRLEQDRRLLTSVARRFEDELDGPSTPRQLVIEALIAEPARCALELEQLAARIDA